MATGNLGIDDFVIEASQLYETGCSQHETPVPFPSCLDVDDQLLLEASQQFEGKDDDTKGNCGRFGEIVTEEDILLHIDSAIPSSTRRATAWGVRVWTSWATHRKQVDSDHAPPLLEKITNQELNHWLARFVMEARNANGKPYIGGTLYGICAAIQRFVREKRVSVGSQSQAEPLDIYKDPKFEYFRKAFDSVLKQLHRSGVGVKKKQADVISHDMEDQLWLEGHLGDDEPKKLLNTLVFCLGLNLALRSGQEHRNLSPEMFSIHEENDGSEYLVYDEFGSKNNGGGLRDRKISNKSVKVFANKENTSRCVLRLFKKYMSLRPPDAPSDVLYLQPLNKPKQDTVWYQARAMGHNSLSKTVRTLCDRIGASGYFTNHSLRRTCATRLFNNGVGEQEIMSVTGHRSKHGVRTYKRMSEKQQQHMSEVLQGREGPCVKKPMEEEDFELSSKKENINPETATKVGGAFNFHGCQVTIINK